MFFKNARDKKACAIGIIGGADGPASTVLKGKYQAHDKSWNKKMEAFSNNVTAEAHTLEEVGQYITHTYEAQSVEVGDRKFKQTYKMIKASLIFKYRPELIKTPMPEENIDFNRAEERDYYIGQIEKRNEEAEQVTDEIFPICVKKYSIPFYNEKVKIGEIEVVMEMTYGLLNICTHLHTDSRKQMKLIRVKTEAIVRDIYGYYGITEQDRQEKTERFMTLFQVMEDSL